MDEIKHSVVASISIHISLTREDNERLSELAAKAKRSRQLEVMLRLYDHLKKNPEIKGDSLSISLKHFADRAASVRIFLTQEANQRLKNAAQAGGRSRKLEAMMRIHDSLLNVENIQGDYWEITSFS